MIRKGDDDVWEFSAKPQLLPFKDELLKAIKHGNRPYIEVGIPHKKCILYLFNSEDSARTFHSGFMVGKRFQYSPDEFWQDILDRYIDANLKGETVFDNGNIKGFEG